MQRFEQLHHELMRRRARLAFLHLGRPREVPEDISELIELTVERSITEERTGTNWPIHSYTALLSGFRGPDAQIIFRTIKSVSA